MLWTLSVAVLVLCALGLVSSCSAGGFVNLFVAVAGVLALMQVLQRRILERGRLSDSTPRTN